MTLPRRMPSFGRILRFDSAVTTLRGAEFSTRPTGRFQMNRTFFRPTTAGITQVSCAAVPSLRLPCDRGLLDAWRFEKMEVLSPLYEQKPLRYPCTENTFSLGSNSKHRINLFPSISPIAIRFAGHRIPTKWPSEMY